MIRTPEELSKPIRMAVDRKAVVLSHIILAIIIAVHTALDPASMPIHIIVAFAVSGALVILILLRFFDLASINSRPKAYLITYQVIIFFGFTFISDPATPYAIGLFLGVFLLNLYYGSKGVWIAVLCYGITSIAKYIYIASSDGLVLTDKMNIIATFIVFATVCNIFINIQKVYDWDRMQLRKTTREAVLEQKRLRVLINSMTESVLVLDKTGVVRLYNAAALGLFDTNSNLIGKSLETLVKLEDEKARSISTDELLPADFRPVVRNDIILRYGKDDTAALSITSTPIRSTFGQELDEEGYIVTMRDITREKSLEDERNEFISVISHELRTPVTVAEAGISNAMLLSAETPENEKITKSLRTAHDQAMYLANMLNDLTTFARAEAGNIELSLEEFDPHDLLSALQDDYRKSIEAKGMNIVSEADDSTPHKIASNRLYVREILQNFITNAMKYSDTGTITLKAKAKEGGILFSVADQGIGISTSDQKNIFEKFFRTEDFRTRSTSGTGLGLYIVKKLAKILEATLDVQSEVGHGSTFSLFVPDKSELLAAKNAEPRIDRMHAEPTPALPA